jgi:hypothetical protein
MELGSVFVQPCLPGDMIDTIPVAVVAGCRVQTVSTFLGMTIIADGFKGRICPMLVLAMNPDGFLGGLASVGTEMTIIAAGNIVIAL